MNCMEDKTTCWCGNSDLLPFGPEYGECRACGTLVYLKKVLPEQLLVRDDETDFYGKKYWLEHQQDAFGYVDIHARARNDLTERNLHWLKVLLKYRLPPAEVLELGCAHGSFVALMQQTGFQASGTEMSPWVVDFGKKTFGITVHSGPVESLDLPSASLDVIALMDVLEHLPDPLATMRHCLELLKPEGLLLIQTPQFREGISHEALIDSKSTFLEQLKSDEHLYLFSERSVTDLFRRLGAEHLQFEPAIFAHYDMFFVVSRTPLQVNAPEQIEAALLATPSGRLALALLDMEKLARKQDNTGQLNAVIGQLQEQLQTSEADRAARLEVIERQGRELSRIAQLEADISDLTTQLQASEADRAARLEVIERQGRELGRIGQLEADINYLTTQLQTSEADRAARLEVIERQGRELGRIGLLEAEIEQLKSQLRSLSSHWWHRLGKKTKAI
jgi:2-polyprenyl-3-methyl-5-hydroxy-6-metoxy-1,4-benzoquinol methylase